MKTNKQILEAFKGQTFSSNEDVMLWLEQSLKDVEERVKAEIVEKVEEDLSYTGVLDNNEQRRGYEKAFAVIKCIINSIK